MREEWELWAGRKKATPGISDADEAAIEVLWRRKDLELLAQIAKVTANTKATEEDKHKAALDARKAEVALLEARKRLLEMPAAALKDLKRQREDLEMWAERQKATIGITDQQAAMVEVAMREKDLELLKEIEAVTMRTAVSEDDRQKAMRERQQGEVALLQSRKKMYDEMQNKGRDGIAFMEAVAKQNKAINDAVQMVIGGQLSEMARQQIDRLGGGGMGKSFLHGIISRGNNQIILLLKGDGNTTDQQIARVAQWLVPNIREAAQRAPI
jgi:hypothetical protein